MKTMYDVRQLLKRFGIFIYTKDRLADLDLIEEEVKGLYDNKLISNMQYTNALLIIKSERSAMK